MERIYLGKSNRANPNMVSNVRDLVSKYNIELVEFTGGNYNSSIVKTCNYLIIVPELSDNSDIIIGKGLYEQITTFCGARKGNKDLVFIIPNQTLPLRCGVLKNLAIIDNTNYIKHALVNFETLCGDYLKDILDDVSPFNLDEIILEKNGPEFMFLITKKLRK